MEGRAVAWHGRPDRMDGRSARGPIEWKEEQWDGRVGLTEWMEDQ
jgi:hypothetical protein